MTDLELQIKLALSNSPEFAIVDKEDYEKVACFAWRLNGDGYAVTGNPKTGTFKFMHDLILPSKQLRDHRDRNKLNNQKSNLRLATKSQNGANSKLRNDSVTGYRGVSFYTRSGKWLATIKVNGKSKNLGYYGTPELAATAYNAAALKAFGEFATLNKLPTPPGNNAPERSWQ